MALVPIDEKGLDREGRWPRPRAEMARLVGRPSRDGAKAIGFFGPSDRLPADGPGERPTPFRPGGEMGGGNGAGAFLAAPQLLGSPSSFWFTEVIYTNFETADWNQGAAYAAVLALLCLAFVFLMLKVFRVSLRELAR